MGSIAGQSIDIDRDRKSMPDCCGPRTQLGKKVSYCVWVAVHQNQFFTKFSVIVCTIRLSKERRERFAVIVVVVVVVVVVISVP